MALTHLDATESRSPAPQRREREKVKTETNFLPPQPERSPAEPCAYCKKAPADRKVADAEHIPLQRPDEFAFFHL